MKKKTTVFDIIFLPITLLGFIIGYSVQCIIAGFVWGEYYFDKETFLKKYNDSKPII